MAKPAEKHVHRTPGDPFRFMANSSPHRTRSKSRHDDEYHFQLHEEFSASLDDPFGWILPPTSRSTDWSMEKQGKHACISIRCLVRGSISLDLTMNFLGDRFLFLPPPSFCLISQTVRRLMPVSCSVLWWFRTYHQSKSIFCGGEFLSFGGTC